MNREKSHIVRARTSAHGEVMREQTYEISEGEANEIRCEAGRRRRRFGMLMGLLTLVLVLIVASTLKAL